MNIVVEADLSGFAPRDCRYSAIDSDTYDGAPDSRTRSTIGYGATPAAAIADLLSLLTDELGLDAEYLLPAWLAGYHRAIKDAAAECERHAQLCEDEAKRGGPDGHLVSQRLAAIYLAERIRKMKGSGL